VDKEIERAGAAGEDENRDVEPDGALDRGDTFFGCLSFKRSIPPTIDGTGALWNRFFGDTVGSVSFWVVVVFYRNYSKKS